MLGDILSSVIDTDTFIIHFHVHACLCYHGKGILHHVSARPAGMIYLVSNVSIFKQVSLNKNDCSIYNRDITSLDKRVWRICPSS